MRFIAVVLCQHGSQQEGLSILFSAAEILKSVNADKELADIQRLIDEMSDADDMVH